MQKTSHGTPIASKKFCQLAIKSFYRNLPQQSLSISFICWFSRWSQKVALRAWSNVKAGTGIATMSPKLVGRVPRSFKDGTNIISSHRVCLQWKGANVRYNYPLKPRLGGSGTGTLRPNVPPADIWQDYQISKFTASKLANIGFVAKFCQPRWG